MNTTISNMSELILIILLFCLLYITNIHCSYNNNNNIDPTTSNTIYYTIGRNEISLYINRLYWFTFDEYYTIDNIYSYNKLLNVLDINQSYQCNLMYNNIYIDNKIPLYSTLSKHNTYIQSVNSGSDINVVDKQVIQYKPNIKLYCNNILNSQHKIYRLESSILDRSITDETKHHIIQQHKQLQLSDDIKPYPFTSIQIIGETLQSDWQWIKEFALNHFGELHKFNTYNNQHTGVYHLNNGNELNSVDDVSDYDSSTKVTIGIGSDWAAGKYTYKCIQYVVLIININYRSNNINL